MQRTRLASVSYLNALPLTWGLSHGSFRGLYDLRMVPPFECARLLNDGLVDVALVPSVEFARVPGLVPVPGTGVTSRNEVRSVLLISRGDPASIGSLAVDLNSRTSVALSRLILLHKYHCRPRIEAMPPDFESMLDRHDAALLIGDAALRVSVDPSLRSRFHVLDLAREWNLMTGMPFVFAFWACRPVVDVSEMRSVLNRSLEEGLMNIDRIAAQEAPGSDLPVDTIASYLRHNIQFRMGPAEADSLRVFYRMCREQGLLSGTGVDGASITTLGTPPPFQAARQRGTADGTGTR